MGINIILPLIMGIAMTVIIGSQVAPSYIEKMKIAKVENRTIANQNLIKDAIVRYIKMEKKVPKDNDLEVLNKAGLLMDYHESNLFGGGYGFTIDKKKGTLKIFTTINDEGASKYFSNSFKFPNKPNCVEITTIEVNGVNVETCKDNLWETFYLLDEETFKSIPIPEVGSIEDIQDRFTKDNIGKKEHFVKNPPQNGDKDYVYIDKGKVEEFVYNGKWVSNGQKNVGGMGIESGVWIKNVKVPQVRIEGEYRITENKFFEKVVCNEKSIEKEVFVVNENTKLGEIVWVAPNSVSSIQTKIFTNNYTPNNICTSNVTTMNQMFSYASEFNQPLDRWDVSSVTDMSLMFSYAEKFNHPLNFDTKNVTNMGDMFRGVKIFNQPLNWNTSNVTNMQNMFRETIKFNQPLNFDTSKVTNMNAMFSSVSDFDQKLNFDTKNVTNMSAMFSNAEKFNQPLNFDTKNVTTMNSMFYEAISFNKPLNFDTSNVTNMNGMFSGAKIFNQALNFDTSNVTVMTSMFYNAKAFNQNISFWCVSKIPGIPSWFDTNTTSWTLPNSRPKWGESCP